MLRDLFDKWRALLYIKKMVSASAFLLLTMCNPAMSFQWNMADTYLLFPLDELPKDCPAEIRHIFKEDGRILQGHDCAIDKNVLESIC